MNPTPRLPALPRAEAVLAGAFSVTRSSFSVQPPMRARPHGTAAAFLLAGCGNKPAEEAPVRPFKLWKVSGDAGESDNEYPAEIRPRIESRLGFRIPGKIVQRMVDVGATVKKGPPLARLDPQDLALEQEAARAALASAQADREVAASDLKRYTDLLHNGFISPADFEHRSATLKTAEARAMQAEANYRCQANQTAYALLAADADGIVTLIEAETGQVVSAGQPVIRLAHTAEKEAAFAVPED
ncbi:MAG: efflux RND transporter periplasmic adaptor subunit [Candidatus Protistobacter heckmanni]|nr:efflux RND transporter periplasmic adaptor subunit [Candidatus Protistobacter heckmanni]